MPLLEGCRVFANNFPFEFTEKLPQRRELSEAQFERRLKWAAIGLSLALFFSAGLTFFTQPSPYMMRDAARWRTFNDGLTQEQADRINKILDEIQSEQKAREEKRNR